MLRIPLDCRGPCDKLLNHRGRQISARKACPTDFVNVRWLLGESNLTLAASVTIAGVGFNPDGVFC